MSGEPQQLFSVTKQDIIDILQETLEVQPKQLTDEEIQYVKLAIKAEAKKIAFRTAVIEKTTVALVWAAIVLGSTFAWHVFREWLVNHGYKP